jgi:two-component system, NtrC family, sensor kinase
VTDWYITAYTPIRDIDQRIIGILYTGVLEAKYRDLKQHTMWIFLGVTILGMVLAFAMSFYLGSTILRRIRLLKQAAEAIAAGDLNYHLATDRHSGFGMLDEAFTNMTRSLKDRDERLQAAYRRLAATERLAALGEMAAGVAHELNNPLGGILLYSNLALEDLPPEHPAREYMEKIIYQTNRSKGIVRGLLDFARTRTDDMAPLSINDVIRTSLNLVKDQSMFLGVRITLDLSEDVPAVMGEQSKLEEVFLNLFINAADAMDGKGELVVKTEFSPSSLVRVTVRDTGKGIEKACLPHIFEPFFTTKEPGQGSGLGLSITYGIIKGHNGRIEVQSADGEGTAFLITLPSLEERDARVTG